MVGVEFPPVAGANAANLQTVTARSDPSHLAEARIFSVRTREEAEYLLTLDHSNGVGNGEWTAFFVESLVGFLVWQNQPWGVVAESDIDWLLGVVSDAPSPSIPALVFALVREMNEAPERLLALAMRLGRGRILA